MSIFAFTGLFGLSLGPVAFGYVAQNLSWRWIQWITVCPFFLPIPQRGDPDLTRDRATKMIVSFCLLTMLPIFLRETRSAIILGRRAAKLQLADPGTRYRAEGDERAPFRVLIRKSLWRPLCM
jgi:MFS family permease